MGEIRMPETSRYYLREIFDDALKSDSDQLKIRTSILINLLRDYAVLEYLLEERTNDNDILKRQEGTFPKEIENPWGPIGPIIYADRTNPWCKGPENTYTGETII